MSISVDGTSVLSSVGAAALTQTSLGIFLVSRSTQDTFSVLTAACTHEACTVSGFNGTRYVCPCHGSQFSTNGAVLNGPAGAPLRSFPSTYAAGVLTFTA